MPTLVIKTFPDALHSKLKQSAVENRRSVTQEAIVLLEHALRENSAPSPKAYWGNRTVIPELKTSIARGAFSEGTDSTLIISEERDSR